ncbi:hypothetical protein [Marinibactrum halimedae]|uniref:Uncharacterized protein n=1 Tax=Marinibactrum halimedae TaxID=1444977 RepID=A0AA37T9Q9_9GAMM|nr:hypothetical protein [Marinibactrum halimedae]MCD9461231.1 hypothetical protein [Marinibactrum halimedae]GLS28059.1 hypothetical protein GCM10007877_37780 [Marinibactrum halimedae]
MFDESFFKSVVVFLPILIAIWIIFENKIHLAKRLLLIALNFFIVVSFSLFYAGTLLKYDYEKGLLKEECLNGESSDEENKPNNSKSSGQ